MLVVHPASLCDVCLDPYIISSEPANSPHIIACGHIFCLTCLRNLCPSACPLCRKTFQLDRVKKLHVASPPELEPPPPTIEDEAAQLLQRVALVSDEDVSDVEIIEVVTEVEEWLVNNAPEDDSHRPLRSALAALQRYKALQERNEREYAEHRRVRRELKAYRRSAHQDSKTSRAVEESLLSRITEIENDHASELSRLHAEIVALRGNKTQQPYRNASNPLPPPPEPLPLDRFPAFARPGGAAEASDTLVAAVPYPPPPPRVSSMTTTTVANGYPPPPSYGTSHAQYTVPAEMTHPFAVPRPRHAEVPRGDERSKKVRTQGVNGDSHQEERRPYAESSRTSEAEARHPSADGRQPIIAGPVPTRRIVVAPSPAPSWAHHPLVEERRSDSEREDEGVRPRIRTNGTNGVVSGGSTVAPRPTVGARLASAEAYLQGYGSGYDSGFQIASEPTTRAPSSYGSDRSDRVYGFPVRESPERPIGGLGLMGVPQPVPTGTVSTPDEDATPVSRARGLTRRNTTQAVDVERSTRRLDDQSLSNAPQNGGGHRAPSQMADHVLGLRRTVTEGGSRHGVNGTDDPAARRRPVSGVTVPLAGEDESPRSETTWGTVQTLSVGGGSMGSLGMLVGLHNGGGVRGQADVSGEAYVGREGVGDRGTSESREEGETETPIIPGGLPGLGSDASSLGVIREDEGNYSGSRHRHALEGTTLRHRSTSYSERNSQGSETTTHDHSAPRRTRRSEGTGEQRRRTSQSSIAEVLQAADDSSRRVAVNASDITSGTNALSLHFDASFPTHDYPGQYTFSATPSGPEIVAPTPIVGGPNIIHLWANRT